MRIFYLLLWSAVLLATPMASAETHPFSIHDMLAMERISDPQISPDGGQLVYALRRTDLEGNRGRTSLWLMPSVGGDARRLTSEEGGASNQRWSPDGSAVLFLSSRSGTSQVWRIAMAGGEAEAVTSEPVDVTSFAISPDGSLLALSMDTFPDCRDAKCTRERLDELAKVPASGRVYDQLLVRHWDSWKDGRRSHLFVRPRDGNLEDVAVDLMAGMDADSPSKPFGGPEEYVFSTDSSTLVFSARDAGREEAWSTNFDLWHVPVDGSTAPSNLTADNLAWDTQPSFSPDGSRLAWLAMKRAGFEADRFRVMVRDLASGTTRALTENWDRSPGGITWSADGRRLLATAANLGQDSLFEIDASSGSVRTIIEQGTVRSVVESPSGLIVALDHLRSPTELHAVDGKTGSMNALTHVNDARLAAIEMGEPEQFTFAGWNNETVHAYVVTPVDFDPAKTYPVAFLIHGGPQGSFGNDFHYRWNPQAYAGAGYGVVMVDFHGSVGYGQEFTDSISGDWGGKPLEDLQKGLAAALERYSWLDGDRVVALGASYGGYMINWIAGQWPDRFRALVNHDGNLDEQMAYYDTEELWFPEWERGGPPWEVPESYQKHNPINHVAKWQTPMLVIHGALDYRVVDTQGLSTFTALQRRGIPSRLLYFPDENHWVLKPQNSIQWHNTVLEWIDQWTKP